MKTLLTISQGFKHYTNRNSKLEEDRNTTLRVNKIGNDYFIPLFNFTYKSILQQQSLLGIAIFNYLNCILKSVVLQREELTMRVWEEETLNDR